MTRRLAKHSKAPFLKRISLREDIAGNSDNAAFPFSVPFVRRRTLDIAFDRQVTIIVGENGTGKSTLLEGIASQCGFNLAGGSVDNRFGNERQAALAPFLRLSWLPKVSRGFFMRAESFFNFASYIDEIARESPPPRAYAAYGGQSLHAKSHGEAFLALFENRFGADSLYILDEPEAALSPSRQFVFLRVLKELESKNCQVIMATHSPMLMAYPRADLLRLEEEGGIGRIGFRETSHYLLMREFMKDPDGFVAGMLRD